jgi:hypothetical protein
MGTYTYTDSQTGKSYTFEYGGDAPTNEDFGAMAQIINTDRERLNQMSMDVMGTPLTPEDDRMALGRGFDIGKTSAYGALGTAARSAGEGIGVDFLRRFGAGMEQSAREEQLREATQMPAPTSLADVEGVGDFLTFVGEGAGQTVPEMLATIGGGLAGGLFGGAPGFVAGSTAVGAPFFAGRNVQRQEQQVALGQLAEVDRTAAFLTALPQAALNSLADKILLTGRALGLSIPASQNLFVRIGQQGAAGAVVEAPTEIAQQMMERAQAGLPLDSEDAIAEYIEAGVLGGIIGAGVGGGLGAFRGPEAPPAPPGATPPAAESALTTPPAGPSVPPTQAPPAVPPVQTAAAPGLTPQEEADIETELQAGTPVEQTQALLRSLLGPRLRPNMYQKLETLGVGPDDPVVLSELEQYIPVYRRNQKLMEVDPGLPDRLRRHIDETRARRAAEAASGQTQTPAPARGPQPTSRMEAQPTTEPEFVLEPSEPDGRGASVPSYRRSAEEEELEAFEAAAELAAAARAAKPRPVGGTVAPTPAAPSGTETQPGTLEGSVTDGWTSRGVFMPTKWQQAGYTVSNDGPQTNIVGTSPVLRQDVEVSVEDTVRITLPDGRVVTTYVVPSDLSVHVTLDIPQRSGGRAPGPAFSTRSSEPYVANKLRSSHESGTFALESGVDAGIFPSIITAARSLKQALDSKAVVSNPNFLDPTVVYREFIKEALGFDAAPLWTQKALAQDALERGGRIVPDANAVDPRTQSRIGAAPKVVERGNVAPTPAAPSGTETQPGALAPDAAPPAYTQESAKNAVRWAAIRAGIPQTPELLAEAANTLVAKGGNPVEVLESLYMPFDAPSDPRLQGVDPFGLAEEAVESTKSARRETLAQTEVQGQPVAQGPMTGAIPGQVTGAAGQVIPAGIPPEPMVAPRAPTSAPPISQAFGPTPVDAAALAAADRTLRTAWEARVAGNPATPLIQDFIAPDGELADPSTVKDRQTVRGLFLKSDKNKGAQGKSAEVIFGKYPTVVQGLDHIAELQSRDANLTGLLSKIGRARLSSIRQMPKPFLVQSYARLIRTIGNALDFFEQGIVANTGANATKWVKANLSPEANYYLMARIEKLKASEAAIKERTTMYDPVAVAQQEGTAAASDASLQRQLDNAVRSTAQEVAKAENIKNTPRIAELPTDVTATEQELADARRTLDWSGAGLRRLPRGVGRGWTGLEIAVARKYEGITTRRKAQAKIEELTDAEVAALHDDAAVEREFLKLYRRFKTVRQAAALDGSILDITRHALMNNNMAAALASMARTLVDPELRTFARLMAANIANTQVTLVDPATLDGFGVYDPADDTISLPNAGDVTVHTVLHEAGHAVTSAYIGNNPNSVEVMDLKTLFSAVYTQVMPYMSSVPYRADKSTPTPEEVTPQEVKEFAAEIQSNPTLRATLRNLNLQELRVPRKGAFQNALEWVNNVYKRIMNTLARRGPGLSALQNADFLVTRIMTPERSAGDALFSRGTRPGTGADQLMQVVRPLRDTAMNPSTRQKYADDASTFLDATNTIGSRTLLGFLPPLAVADIAAKVGVADPYRMFELVQRRDGMFSRAAQTVDSMLNRLTKYYQQRAEKREFDTLTTDSTVNNMDPSIDPAVPATQDRNYTKFWLAFDVLDQGGNILRTERRWFDSPADRDNAIIRLNAKTPATRTRARTAGDARTPGELQTLQNLKDRFNALSPEGQAMYRQLRDFYEARYDELWKVLQGQMDTILGTDPRTAAEAKQSLYVKLFDKGQIRPYFPLVREGDYWLEFSAFNAATNSTEVVKMTFETRGARERMIAQLATAPEVQKDADGVPIINQYMASDMAQTSFRTDALFVKNIMDVFDKFNAAADDENKISDEIMNDIAALIVKAAPEGSMARQLHKRNNTPGYIEDAEVALHNKGYRLANAAARQVSSFAIRKQAQEYREAIAKNPSRSQQLVMEELVKFGDSALSPMDSPAEQAAQMANRIAYGYTLLGNVSSFIVNLSSMANVIFPQLGGRYGFNKATSELTRASRLFLSSGTERIVRRDGVDTQLSALPSIDNYYIMEENGDYVVRTDIQMDAAKRQRLERMAPLLKQMSERGMLHHSLFYDSLGLQDFAEGRSRSDKAYAFFGAPFHVVERMNRQATAIAAYELELQRLTTENAAAGNPRAQAELQVDAANEAIYQTTQMNGGASLNTAPRFTQRGLMRVAMMYKSYGITVTTLLFKTARQVVNNIYGSTPEMKAERDIAMRQMVGHLGITFLLAGAHGLPMFGLASVIYNMLKDEEEISFDEAVRLQTSEMFYKGPVNALTGFEISERVGLSELLYRANRYNDDPSAEETIVQLLGGPAWSTFSGIKRGINDMREGEYYRGLESMLPLMVSNPMRAWRFYSEGGGADARGQLHL